MTVTKANSRNFLSQHYGLEFIEHIKIDIPLKESAPRVPSPYGDNIFYYAQVDEIRRLAKGKKWKWNELRPDAIVGFLYGIQRGTFKGCLNANAIARLDLCRKTTP